jgi:hypothetical protein
MTVRGSFVSMAKSDADRAICKEIVSSAEFSKVAERDSGNACASIYICSSLLDRLDRVAQNSSVEICNTAG